MNGKLGTASSVKYFVNYEDPNFPKDWAVLAPYSDFPCPDGWALYFATTLGDVDRLEARLTEQERRKAEREHAYDEAVFGALRQKVRDQLMARLLSSNTNEYDKDFIREWMKLRSEKRARHTVNYEARQVILYERHNDIPKDRDANVERVDLDRIG